MVIGVAPGEQQRLQLGTTRAGCNEPNALAVGAQQGDVAGSIDQPTNDRIVVNPVRAKHDDAFGRLHRPERWPIRADARIRNCDGRAQTRSSE